MEHTTTGCAVCGKPLTDRQITRFNAGSLYDFRKFGTDRSGPFCGHTCRAAHQSAQADARYGPSAASRAGS